MRHIIVNLNGAQPGGIENLRGKAQLAKAQIREYSSDPQSPPDRFEAICPSDNHGQIENLRSYAVMLGLRVQEFNSEQTNAV